MRRGAAAVLTLTVALGSAACSRDVELAPPEAQSSGQETGARDQASQQALNALADAVEGTGSTPSGALARAVVANAGALGVRQIALRDTGTPAGDAATVTGQYGARAWADAVDVSYTIPGDTGPTSLETAVVFEPDGDGGARIVATGGLKLRGALWLQRAVTVRRTDRSLLIAATNQPIDKYAALTARAVQDVSAVLPKWRDLLVVEVPADRQQLEQNLLAPAGRYALLAGVSVGIGDDIDASTADTIPVHSFLNPDQIKTQGPKGAQVVASHEATLQATRAPVHDIPIWAAEGFADYVPLRTAGLPLRTSAREIIAEVRRSGPPDHLPTVDDYDPDTDDLDKLNAVYESAWLAFVLVGARYGEDKVVELYDAVDRGEPTPFRSVLGISQAAFVAQWQAYLRQVAAADG